MDHTVYKIIENNLRQHPHEGKTLEKSNMVYRNKSCVRSMEAHTGPYLQLVIIMIITLNLP